MMLRGALSGFGEVAAQAHLAGWGARPDVNIVAIHDPAAARRHHAIRLLKNIRVYDDLELMLDGEAPDFLDIASPPAFHAPAIRSALASGAHVIVEKPLCLDNGEYAVLSATAKKNSRVLMCMHNWKYSPVYRRAHELIEAGALGEPDYVSLVRLRDAPAGHGSPAGGQQWRRGAASGGGILIDHGWHVFYLMRWLMNAAPTAISAKLICGAGGLDEIADLRVEFADRVGYSHLSWRAPVRRTSATIHGGAGLIEIEGDRLTFTRRSGEVEHFQDGAEDAGNSYHPSWFTGMAAEFVRAIDEGHDGPAAARNADEVRTAIALTAAARHSAASNGIRIEILSSTFSSGPLRAR
ncbi:MAG: Gfo/Idh/MocA family protein [Candidatus Binataceae bacterium]